MADKPVLYGFDGSTFVRTVRMVLRNKGVAYDQVPVNVLKRETSTPEHLARHPFGKVPVLDIDGIRILETDAICRYLEGTRPEGPSTIPGDAKDRARMNMVVSMIGSYGYGNLLGVAGYHLFPDFLGNPDQAFYDRSLAAGETLMRFVMQVRGDDPWIAGAAPSLADYFLGPIVFYGALTPAAETLMAVPGAAEWWVAMQALESFAATAPDLG
ncbi:MAG: glutathione S-transferase family protein [Pseudomonadota bacterium]